MKKFIITAMAALMSLAIFAGCSYTTDTKAVAAQDEAVDLTKAKVGYGVTITKAEADELVLTTSSNPKETYTQAAIELPYVGYVKAEVEFTTTGPTTIGFLKEAANPWDGRIAGADQYADAIATKTTRVFDIPAGAAFITFGSNNANDVVITISKITIKAE